MKTILGALVALGALATGACADGSAPLGSATSSAATEGADDHPAGVTIDPPNATLISLSETVQLKATVHAAQGDTVEAVAVRWTSLAESVATVTSSGLVTAHGNGIARIRAAIGEGAGALSDTADVLVAQEPAFVLVEVPTGDVAAGLPLSVTVTVEDALHNRVLLPSLGVTLALLPNNQNAMLIGTLATDAVDGVATFSDVSVSRAGRRFVLSAAAGSVSGTSPPFDVRLRLSSISVGSVMACGLAPSGDAYCWGRNRAGGLGTGQITTRQTRPALVVGDHTFVQVDAGSGSNIEGLFDGGGCGLTAAGAAYCWGRNDFGQLGNGTTGVDSRVPVAVSGGIAFQSISVGRDHACGLALSGDIHCWGSNQHGQLGNDNRGVHSGVPVLVAGGLSYTALFIGDIRTCALATSGDVYCWGDSGPTSFPGSSFVNAPALLSGGLSFVEVDPGTFLHFCGVTVSHGGYCWGQDLGGGELGTGTPGQNEIGPALVTGGHEWAYIGADGLFSCGLRVDGAALCWGNDNNGELGQGTVGSSRPVPSLVVGGIAFTQMDVGHGTVCALAANGDAYCWGSGFEGERGDGSSVPQAATPVKVVTP
jgi:hypothetical protein